VRHVDRHELDAGLLEAKQEMRVAGEPIEATYDELGVEGAAGVERSASAGRLSARFPLSTSTNSLTSCQRPRSATPRPRRAGFKAEAALALPLGGNAQSDGLSA
jgi:hypothetical protein